MTYIEELQHLSALNRAAATAKRERHEAYAALLKAVRAALPPGVTLRSQPIGEPVLSGPEASLTINLFKLAAELGVEVPTVLRGYACRNLSPVSLRPADAAPRIVWYGKDE